MAKGKTAEPETFQGRSIRKRIYNLGIAGIIERTDQDPETPPEAEVTFQATAKVTAQKFRFLENGGVEASTILAIDGGTFHILNVVEKEPDPELPLAGEGEGGE